MCIPRLVLTFLHKYIHNRIHSWCTRTLMNLTQFYSPELQNTSVPPRTCHGHGSRHSMLTPATHFSPGLFSLPHKSKLKTYHHISIWITRALGVWLSNLSVIPYRNSLSTSIIGFLKFLHDREVSFLRFISRGHYHTIKYPRRYELTQLLL
jgi:hypothetical protein